MGTHDVLHLDDLQPAVELGHKVRRARERDGARADETPVEGRVLADTLAEGPALEVDSEGRHLLRQAEQVDGCVEQVGLEFGVEVDLPAAEESYEHRYLGGVAGILTPHTPSTSS